MGQSFFSREKEHAKNFLPFLSSNSRAGPCRHSGYFTSVSSIIIFNPSFITFFSFPCLLALIHYWIILFHHLLVNYCLILYKKNQRNLKIAHQNNNNNKSCQSSCHRLFYERPKIIINIEYLEDQIQKNRNFKRPKYTISLKTQNDVNSLGRKGSH